LHVVDDSCHSFGVYFVVATNHTLSLDLRVKWKAVRPSDTLNVILSHVTPDFPQLMKVSVRLLGVGVLLIESG